MSDDAVGDNAVDTACRWDGVDDLRPVWAELARRLSASSHAVVSVRIANLDTRGRGRLASLLDLRRPPDEASVVIGVPKLLTALGLEVADLRPFIERLTGRLQDRRADRVAYRRECDLLWADVQAQVGARIPQTVARWRGAGVPDRDIARHARLLKRLEDLIERLPLVPPTPLPVVAFQAWGDPHALDDTTRAGSMLGSAVLELEGHADSDDLSLRRRALTRAGILADRLSTPTLTWGITARGSGVLDDMLRAGAQGAAPVHICGATLDRGAPEFGPQSWLCVENPSLIELAIQAGVSMPMVCVSGWPSDTTVRLLRIARDQGVELEYAGDYDPTGLRIAARMADTLGVIVRMPVQVYVDACSGDGEVWTEAVPPTPWDPALRSTVQRLRRVVYQESSLVWHDLLGLRP